jgi:hypothetical protein
MRLVTAAELSHARNPGPLLDRPWLADGRNDQRPSSFDWNSGLHRTPSMVEFEPLHGDHFF